MDMTLWNLFEILGTGAFAASGALTGIRKRFDFFGVLMLALITAVGGGILRDGLMGNLPPLALRFPRYSLLALVTAAAVFLSPRPVQRLERLIQVLDAVGLGAFTAGGGLLAIQRGFGEPFMVVAFGLLTSVGGGILRDVLAGEPPLVFRREIYALASIAGALLLLPLNRRLGVETALYACFALVVSLRLFCVLRGIHLPLARKG